jgi:RimJ/RimL family protein N-acetyltransferase
MILPTRPRPTLIGRRVVLRPIVASDAADMHASLADAETMRLTGTSRTFTLEEVRAHCAGLEDRVDRVDLAIRAPDDDRWLGEVVLMDVDAANRSAAFRIALARERLAGRGLGREAARRMLAWGFDELGLHRVSLEAYAFNARAIHVYEALGFRHEGRLREALWQDGAWHDALAMGMLAGELVREA